jgi:hypothetical protein
VKAESANCSSAKRRLRRKSGKWYLLHVCIVLDGSHESLVVSADALFETEAMKVVSAVCFAFSRKS